MKLHIFARSNGTTCKHNHIHSEVFEINLERGHSTDMKQRLHAFFFTLKSSTCDKRSQIDIIFDQTGGLPLKMLD